MILLVFIAKHLYKKSKIYCRVNELYLNFIYRISQSYTYKAHSNKMNVVFMKF